MTLSAGETLTAIGLILTVFGFIINKVIKLTRDIVELAEKYDAVKFSMNDRLLKLEERLPIEIRGVQEEMRSYFSDNNRNISALKDAISDLNLNLVNKINENQKEIFENQREILVELRKRDAS